MGLKDMLNSAVSSVTRTGEVNGAEFPVGTYVNVRDEEDDGCLMFTYPNKTTEKITHDMIKCATVLAMGVIDIKNNGNQTTEVYGTKYLCVFKDGRQAVLTVGMGKMLYRIEHVLF